MVSKACDYPFEPVFPLKGTTAGFSPSLGKCMANGSDFSGLDQRSPESQASALNPQGASTRVWTAGATR
jgi:hypothetical protein